MNMTNQEIGTELNRIYQQHNEFLRCRTAEYIINAFDNDNPDMAYSEYVHDGDKLPRYTDWGKQFEDFLYEHFGCRTHRVVKCQAHFCRRRQ